VSRCLRSLTCPIRLARGSCRNTDFNARRSTSTLAPVRILTSHWPACAGQASSKPIDALADPTEARRVAASNAESPVIDER